MSLETSASTTTTATNMFTSISSYIWGASNPEEDEVQQTTTTATTEVPPAAASSRRRDESPATPEDWVLVGNQPAPGDLAGHHPLPSLTPSTPSAASSVIGEEEETPAEAVAPAGAPVGQDNTRVPVRMSHDHTVGLKGLKSAQICKQRSSGKALSSKALKRSNQAVINGKRKETVRYNLPIKSAGLNKNLKQC